MAANKRNPEQREADLRRIARARLRGCNQYEIAALCGLSQQQISSDLKTLRQRWLKETQQEVGDMIAEEVAMLNETYAQLWDSFEESKEKMEGGDPRLLHSIIRCIEKRIEVLGIKPPTKIAPTTPDGRGLFDPPYDDDRREELAKRIDVLKSRYTAADDPADSDDST